MRRMIGGRMFDIPEETDGSVDVRDVQRAAGIGDKEILIEQLRDGRNKILPPHGHYRFGPDSALMTAPLIRRGR